MSLNDTIDLERQIINSLADLNDTPALPYHQGVSRDRTSFNVVNASVGITLGEKQEYRLTVQVSHHNHIPRIKEQLQKDQIVGEKVDWQDISLRVVEKPAVPFYGKFGGARIAHKGAWVRSNYEICGTLGCLVKTPDSKTAFLLSCNHVIADLNNARRHDPIVCVLPEKELTKKKAISILSDYLRSLLGLDVVASLEKFVNIQYSNNNSSVINDVDAAIAKVVNFNGIKVFTRRSEAPLSFPISPLDFRQENITERLLGESVYKVGAVTGESKGKIKTVFKNFAVDYGKEKIAYFSEVIVIEGEAPFAKPGDSGSIVYDTNGQVVGLFFAGNEKLQEYYAIPIAKILKHFNIELFCLTEMA